MRLEDFTAPQMGSLVDIAGSDPILGSWEHKAFVPAVLPSEMPELSGRTVVQVANARSSLAALDAVALQLPNPALFRSSALRREAQSTSALEGAYAPLERVMTTDVDSPEDETMREIVNYLDMSYAAFEWLSYGREISVGMLTALQGELMKGTRLAGQSGRLRERQVVIGKRSSAKANEPAILSSRFVPAPPGDLLISGVERLVEWIGQDHSERIDPVVAAAMSHYQFETLHPFMDGNGRLGRLLIVLHLMSQGVLSEPTLSVSPWFEACQAEYYDRLLAVSTAGNWDEYVEFFARGIGQSASQALRQVQELMRVRNVLKGKVRDSGLRSEAGLRVVDLAIAKITFTTKALAEELDLSVARAGELIRQLENLEILAAVNESARPKVYFAPAIVRVLV
ncbi:MULTISPECIES: Fic family protein [Actinotignum]|uniref:Fic family protein n=1 Tax=Actinotignum TaxID=1653174 RepID=UPI00254A8EB6|nr:MULTISPECIES: Fic family protein [Actinotignum]MDE1536025.1 Fic family protein [Actinotignum schaalii]MDK7272348.1 Fic family protein [Actinotignum schaalii]MDY5145246.1 Fic family protein [Actinotignum timonense]